ncbi:MAG: CRISPR-associated endonuclease Cas1, partial [Gammaproteobacteria bacterium]|nr:CRISPR-associated endonuclease Cas1 [Gammaproteobacteria bacterium]
MKRLSELPWSQLLPLHAVTVTLRFLQPSQFQFFHQPALTAFLRTLLGESDGYENEITCDALESGVLAFAAGDRYRFTIFALGGRDQLLQRLLDKLQQLPFSATDVGPDAPLRNNVALDELHDLWGGHPISDHSHLTPYSDDNWQQEVTLWARAPSITLRWLSPVRLLLPKSQRDAGNLKGEARFCRQPGDVGGDLLYQRLHSTLTDLLRRQSGRHLVRPDHLLPTTSDSDLFWVDAHYRDRGGKRNSMGGILGKIVLGPGEEIPTPLLSQWVLAQYLGIGQRRSFGWGRFRLESAAGDHVATRPPRAEPLLQRIATEENLTTAWEAIDSNRRSRQPPPQPEADDDQLWGDEDLYEEETPQRAPGNRLQRLGAQLAGRSYSNPPLQGVIHHDNDGEPRALAIPPFFDRVAQRASSQLLAPGLDQLMYHGSFGFRVGHSRQQVRDLIQRAYQEGYRWIYESDISDFFDSVRWSRLETRLASLYDDLPLQEQIMAWVKAPVLYQGEMIHRSSGLPQGSPISPLLANLLLDDFDADLDLAGFRLLRFADDFIVLCKDRKTAEEAATAAEQSLDDLGLKTHPDKSRIVHIDDGFRYLGYLFVGALALDASTKEEPKSDKERPAPVSGWLAKLGHRPVQPLDEGRVLAPKPAESDASWQPPTPQPMANRGSVVVISGEASQLSSRQQQLTVNRNSEVVRTIPWRQIQALLLMGPHHITTPALRHALQQGVTVHFADTLGRYQGATTANQPAAEGLQLWELQLQRQHDHHGQLAAARRLVFSRIQSQIEMVRQLQPAPSSARLAPLRAELSALEQATDRQQLNGHEGIAARHTFALIAEQLPQDLGFDGRTRRPPRDPTNALLSLGYTLLYARSDSLIRSSGLLPWRGFY